MPLAAAQEGIENVCIVTGGGQVNDGTFNQFAYEGMLRAAEDFDLTTTALEPQAPIDYSRSIDSCVQEGFDVLITVGYTIYDDTLAAAEANPDTYFIGVDHFDTGGLPNYVGLDFRDDQAGFLMGVMAALVTETDMIAAVYGPSVPQVVRFRNGYEQGARYINPDIDVQGVYLDSFETPDRGASTASQFIGEGADVIFGVGGPTGTGAITYAAGEGVWVIGVDQDEFMTSFNGGETPGADRVISSAIKRIDNAVYDMLEVLAEGDFENFPGGSNYLSSAANGGVDFAPQHDADIPPEIHEQVREVLEKLGSGEIETGVDPITGELLDEVSPDATEEAE
ncbi:MAG TPA: BMP family ABC transporter substrate-binding protein [Aggregatilineales bacterium]|nr:BMP family ABC transporter substrate-binding protein [Aggregatilineales bacterium]